VKNTWQMQQAKSQFCAVAEHAVGGKPQVVTKHGRPFVVIVGAEDWKNARPGKKTLLEALRACPVDLSDLDLTRSKELPRPLSL
jgi:prevent-host-death family protein